MVLNELEDRAQAPLADHQRRDAAATIANCSRVVKEEYENIVKNEVQRAIAADEDALEAALRQLHRQRQGLHAAREGANKFTGQYDEPDERLMRSIEEKIDIPDSRKDDFRREIMNYIGALRIDGKTFDYKTNERLHKALELKLFEDQKDTIKLTSLVSNVVDADTQAEDRRRQEPPDSQLRLRRESRDRRAAITWPAFSPGEIRRTIKQDRCGFRASEVCGMF